MVNQELLDFIKKALVRGMTPEKIKQDLLAHGWLDYDINEAMDLAQHPQRMLPGPETFQHKNKSKNNTRELLILGGILLVLVGAIIYFLIKG